MKRHFFGILFLFIGLFFENNAMERYQPLFSIIWVQVKNLSYDALLKYEVLEANGQSRSSWKPAICIPLWPDDYTAIVKPKEHKPLIRLFQVPENADNGSTGFQKIVVYYELPELNKKKFIFQYQPTGACEEVTIEIEIGDDENKMCVVEKKLPVKRPLLKS